MRKTDLLLHKSVFLCLYFKGRCIMACKVGAWVHIQLLLLCLILCNPRGCTPLVSSVHWVSRQEYWSGLVCRLPVDLPYQGIKSDSSELAGGLFTISSTWEALKLDTLIFYFPEQIY